MTSNNMIRTIHDDIKLALVGALKSNITPTELWLSPQAQVDLQGEIESMLKVSGRTVFPFLAEGFVYEGLIIRFMVSGYVRVGATYAL
jgi:hypothetical protein